MLFFRVLGVHILLYGHTFPMAYCLLPNKERQMYNSVHAPQGCCSSEGYISLLIH